MANAGNLYPTNDAPANKSRLWQIGVIIALLVLIIFLITGGILYIHFKDKENSMQVEIERLKMEHVKQEVEQTKQEVEQAKKDAKKALDKTQQNNTSKASPITDTRVQTTQIPKESVADMPNSVQLSGEFDGDDIAFFLTRVNGDTYSGTFDNYTRGISSWSVSGKFNSRKMNVRVKGWTFSATGDGNGNYSGRATHKGGSSGSFRVSL